MIEERHATVDVRRESLIVASYSRTTAGFWVGNEHFEILDRSIDDERVGLAVRAALVHSRTGVPVPDWSTLPIAPILAALGLKTFGAYVQGTKSVGVFVGECVTLRPNRNAGAREGFVEIDNVSLNLPPDAAPAILGHAIREALSIAR